jgi:type IV secretion system protein VirD4
VNTRRADHGYRYGPAGRGEPLALGVLAAVVMITGWFTATMSLSDRLWAGRWPHLTPGSLLAATARSRSHLSDPAGAWPRAVVGAHPPPPWLMYTTGTAILAVAAAAALALRAALAHGPAPESRRAGRAGGARWAAPADTRALRVGRRATGNRLVLGRMERQLALRPLVATEARHSVLVLGPTQSGKTSGLAIPAILDWSGPVIATSVKDDLARITLASRGRQGPVWVFDPTAGSGLGLLARWSPLSACGDWAAAQRMASWLVDATPARAGMADAAFWYAAAAKQLAPLLLAATRGGYTMADVVRWTNGSDLSEPGQVLHVAGDIDAALALSACENRDERIRSSVLTTLETVLAPFEDPEVARWTSACDVDLGDVVSSPATLFLCGPSHEQARVQGLFAALVSAAIAAATARVATLGRPLDPPLLVVLDEAANIAPVRDLDTIASTGAGLGVQMVTVCQDLSQLAARYGQDRARTIVNNHRAKLLLSGVSDLSTLDLVSGLAGEQAVRQHTYTLDQSDGRRSRSSAVAFRRLAPADELRRVPPGRGVLVYGHLPPVRLRLRPWFADRRLRAVAGGAGQGAGQRAGQGAGLRARLGATRGGSPGILG